MRTIKQASLESAITIKNILNRYRLKRRFHSVVTKWEKSGRALPPPPEYKFLAVINYSKKNNHKVLIETGTYRGNMLLHVQGFFDEIYSIEIQESLFLEAQKLLRRFEHIHLVCGDSAVVLPDLVQNLGSPSLVWLDAHYSAGETGGQDEIQPILHELTCLLSSNLPHTILIDDAKDFTGKDGYPTLKNVEKQVRTAQPNAAFEVKDNIVRIEL